MKKDIFDAIEKMVEIAQNNFGVPDNMYIADPDTGEFILVNINNPSNEAKDVIKKIIGRIDEKEL